MADPGLIRAVETIQQARILCPPHPQQRAFVRMMSGEIKWLRGFILEETPSKYKKIAELVCRELRKIDGLRFLEPEGGFYVFFDIREFMEDSKKFVGGLLREWQVALAPGVDFGMEGWVRLSYAPAVEEPDKLVEGIERMKKFIDSLR